MILIYNIIFPFLFILFIPSIIIKLIRRPGYKKTYWERFAIYSREKKNLIKDLKNPIWIHAVSVGETVIAMNLIKEWQKLHQNKPFILSTTTTTGQTLAREKKLENVIIIYCPIDLFFFVRKVVKMIKPKLLVIFETEIWPNLICETRKTGGEVILVNARMSDKSVKGYRKFKKFFSPILQQLNFICVQTEQDKERFISIEPSLTINVSGNMKFDQEVPSNLPKIDLKQYFGEEKNLYILAASTHPKEEVFIAKIFKNLLNNNKNLKLIIVPRHAERGSEIENDLKNLNIRYHRKTSSEIPSDIVDCLLADTTGELMSFINQSDIILMGKSFAGQDEGHNLIEPALLAKPIITGCVLRNFRLVLNILKNENAIITIQTDNQLEENILKLIQDSTLRVQLGNKAKNALLQHKGATKRIIEKIDCSFGIAE